MELSINFLLRWRGIVEDPEMDWLTNYLRVYDVDIHPDVNSNNLEDVEFCLPNYDRTSRGRSSYGLPPRSKATTLHEAMEIILAYKKS
jgi:hypothetical protein